MRKLLLIIVVLMAAPAIADDTDYRMGIDGELHSLAGREHKELKHERNHEIDRILKEMENPHKTGRNPVVKNEVRRPNRIWVNDVAMPGLRYYGYYAAVNGGWEFRYSRRDIRAALSNFDSLNPVYNKYIRRNQPVVKVVYEYPY